jgi:hypothetical protein
MPDPNRTPGEGREVYLWPLAKDDPRDAPKIVSMQQMEAFASEHGLCLVGGPDQCVPDGWYTDVTWDTFCT